MSVLCYVCLMYMCKPIFTNIYTLCIYLVINDNGHWPLNVTIFGWFFFVKYVSGVSSAMPSDQVNVHGIYCTYIVSICLYAYIFFNNTV